jgi:hypothetical protein
MKKVMVAMTVVSFLLEISASAMGLTLFKLEGRVENHVNLRGLAKVTSLVDPASSALSMSPPVEWNKTYGGLDDDYVRAVQETNDGGYALAGYTYSYGDGSNDDFWLVKVASNGNMQWNRTYGDIGIDEAFSMVQTNDGGYALAGRTDSFGAGMYDFWLVKTDSQGNMQWNKTYGGSLSENAWSLEQTSDGGYIIAGDTASFGAGSFDFWVVKTDSYGTIQWNKTYGGTGFDVAYAVQQSKDGGYIVAGYTSSLGAGSFDVWLVKIDSSGNQQWADTYGGIKWDVAYSFRQTMDGGYLGGGSTSTSGAGLDDFFLVKTDDLGNQQFNKTYGGTNSESASCVIQSKEGGYAIAGVTNSFGVGSFDSWLVKTDVNGNVQWNATYGGSEDDYAESVRQTSDAGYVVAGYTFSFGAGGSDAWLVRLASADTVPPLTINDYDGLWHDTDFTITLTATDDLSGVSETYYKLDNGVTKNVSINGQPRITVESANNTLVYWSIDRVGHQESPTMLTEIKLDKTSPVGSIAVNNGRPYTNSTLSSLTLSATDATSGVYKARCSNDGVWDTEVWELFASTKPWTLLSGDGNKTVYYQVMDNAGLVSSTASYSIVLDTSPPVASLINPASTESFSTSTLSFNASAIDFESGISKVELYVDDKFKGNMTLTSRGTYVLTISAVNDGGHGWYVRAYNGAGSAVTPSTRTFTVQTGEGPQERGPDNMMLLYVVIALAAILTLASAYYIFRRRKR